MSTSKACFRSPAHRVPGCVARTCCSAIILASLVLSAARSAGAPATTQAVAAESLSERQTSILLQLADAEANIKAINKALVRTGYKVGLAYEQVEGGQKANELMDRKGGGPVPWEQFYGKTAMGFYHHASADLHVDKGRGAATLDAQWTGGKLTRIERPAQFDSIYRANQQQMARAQEQIASLLQDQAALLARRQKHEGDQSSLWAAFAWEQIKDREVAFRPIYRFKLVPAGARAELLRGPILFLRTLDRAVSEALDGVETDQPATFTELRQHTKDAYTVFQGSMADALLAEGLSSSDRGDAQAIKLICKQLAEECVVMVDNYRRAMDSDKAKEDASKLEYRQQLQSSLSDLARLTGNLDDKLAATVETWSLKPDRTVDNPDKLPTWAPRPPAAAIAPVTTVKPEAPVDNEAHRVAATLNALRPLWERPASTKPTPITQSDCLQGDATWETAPSGAIIDGTYQVGTNKGNHPGGRDFKGHLVVPAAFELNGGTLLIAKGEVDLQGTAERPIICRNVAFRCEMSAILRAEHTVFEHCTFAKAGSWYAFGGYDSRWAFTECVLHASSFDRFGRQEVGFAFNRCTFVELKLARRDWAVANNKEPDVAQVLTSQARKWDAIDDCAFYNCDLSVGSFWAMRRCNFFDCSLGDDGNYSSKSDLPLELGVLPDDRRLVEGLRLKTTATGKGRVTYVAAPALYANAGVASIEPAVPPRRPAP